MENFIYSIPTDIYFGKGQIRHLPKIITKYGKRVLLVYGGGSIKRNGIYDTICDLLKKEGIAFWELSGVEPNPRITSVRKGVDICRQYDIEVVVPVGGGSAIDCAKAVASAVSYEGDAWDLLIDPSRIVSVLPVITVLTLTATGSEMGRSAVISNMDTNDKKGFAHPDMRPKASILDPTYTFTVNAYQTAAGTADIMSHIIEAYFSKEEGYMQDRMAEGLLKTCIAYGSKAIAQPDDYEARANLLWTGSWAMNNVLKLGKNIPWSVHPMEHQLSAYYDITHGAGLAILTPHWMEYVLDETTADKFAEYARNVWDVSLAVQDPMQTAKEGIRRTAEYFQKLGLPSTLREAGITDTDRFEAMAKKAATETKQAYRTLTKEDILCIFQAAF